MVYCEDHVLIYTIHTNQDHSTTIPFSFFLSPPLLSNVYPVFSVSHKLGGIWKERKLSELHFHIHSQEEISNENENTAH